MDYMFDIVGTFRENEVMEIMDNNLLNYDLVIKYLEEPNNENLLKIYNDRDKKIKFCLSSYFSR